MLKYSDLTKAQKKAIDAMVQYEPSLANAETVATRDIHFLVMKIYGDRASGGPKIGYPNWLTKHNSIRRGVVAFPGPGSKGLTEKEQTELQKSKLQKVLDESQVDEVESISDDEFMAELRANGIEV